MLNSLVLWYLPLLQAFGFCGVGAACIDLTLNPPFPAPYPYESPIPFYHYPLNLHPCSAKRNATWQPYPAGICQWRWCWCTSPLGFSVEVLGSWVGSPTHTSTTLPTPSVPPATGLTVGGHPPGGSREVMREPMIAMHYVQMGLQSGYMKKHNRSHQCTTHTAKEI